MSLLFLTPLQASLPKKAKIETKRFTQAELIAQALDTEEGNIIEHRDYLKNEAEKRKRARVVRTAITGPLLRWTSRKEEEVRNWRVRDKNMEIIENDKV